MKSMKRDSVSVNVHIRRDTPSPCTQLYSFWMTPPPPPPPIPLTYLINGSFLKQKTYKDSPTKQKANFFAKKNSIVG